VRWPNAVSYVSPVTVWDGQMQFLMCHQSLCEMARTIQANSWRVSEKLFTSQNISVSTSTDVNVLFEQCATNSFNCSICKWI